MEVMMTISTRNRRFSIWDLGNHCCKPDRSGASINLSHFGIAPAPPVYPYPYYPPPYPYTYYGPGYYRAYYYGYP